MNKCMQLAKGQLGKEQDASAAVENWPMYLMDIAEDERKERSTKDMGEATVEIGNYSVSLLDTPGNFTMINEVIKACSVSTLAILVVSVKKCEKTGKLGEEYATQIQDQLFAARSQGITNLIVVVNKMDTVKWAKSKFDIMKAGILNIASKVGYLVPNVKFIPMAALSGSNIIQSQSNWYNGQSLAEALENYLLSYPCSDSDSMQDLKI